MTEPEERIAKLIARAGICSRREAEKLIAEGRVTYKGKIIDTPEKLLREKMHCRVTIDLPITFEEANFIKEQFVPEYKLRELMLIPEKVEVESSNTPIDINFESVDTIVMNQINAIESDSFDKALLLEIYRDL